MNTSTSQLKEETHKCKSPPRSFWTRLRPEHVLPALSAGEGSKAEGSVPKGSAEQFRDAVRRKHYSLSTKQTYVSWIKRYILLHSERHPREMGTAESWWPNAYQRGE